MTRIPNRFTSGPHAVLKTIPKRELRSVRKTTPGRHIGGLLIRLAAFPEMFHLWTNLVRILSRLAQVWARIRVSTVHAGKVAVHITLSTGPNTSSSPHGSEER